MCVYIGAKFEVCSIILTSFRQGVILPPPPPSSFTSKRTPKKPTQIRVKGTITIAPLPVLAGNPDNNNKEEVFKNCFLFNDCISKVNNTQIDNAKDVDVVMQMYNLIEYSDNYSKASGSLWQYYRDEP